MSKIIGRAFLSTFFILSAVASIYSWDIAYTDLDTALVNWQMYKGNSAAIGGVLDNISDYVMIILVVGLFLELIGGLLVFFGYRVRLGATFLAIYLFFATLLFCPFWFYEDQQMSENLVLFLKNVSILGGILLLFSRGSSRGGLQMMDDDM